LLALFFIPLLYIAIFVINYRNYNLSLFNKLFKQTAIYGIATVVPRMFSFLLTPLYTDDKVMNTAEYGEVSIIFSWLVLFNVILAYGMETSFFRFYHSDDKKQVLSTSTISLFWSSILFLCTALIFRNFLADAADKDVEYITYTIWILVFDALVIIPFSRLRAEGRPMLYAAIKIGNVALNLGLNLFFLLFLPQLAANHPDSFLATIYIEDFEVGYVFVANVIASLATLLVLLPHYIRLSWHFNKALWKRMMPYSLPIMVAGIAFAINETFDRILLEWMGVPIGEIGAYSACYKLALFMTLFATAFRLGIEPFFFSHAGNANAPQTYADITKYFVIFGSAILLCVVVFSDVLKVLLIRDPSYWTAMKVVPLIILANFCLGIYHNLSVWYKLSDKTKIGAYISVIGAVVTLVLNFLLIDSLSYYGSAIATLAAYGTMMLLSFYFGNKYYPIPYDVKKISLYLGLSIVLSAISFYVDILRETYIFGILAIAVFFAIIYKNEKATLQRFLKRG
jgi:O-antigen/teichoic acid export membrane protein